MKPSAPSTVLYVIAVLLILGFATEYYRTESVQSSVSIASEAQPVPLAVQPPERKLSQPVSHVQPLPSSTGYRETFRDLPVYALIEKQLERKARTRQKANCACAIDGDGSHKLDLLSEWRPYSFLFFDEAGLAKIETHATEIADGQVPELIFQKGALLENRSAIDRSSDAPICILTIDKKSLDERRSLRTRFMVQTIVQPTTHTPGFQGIKMFFGNFGQHFHPEWITAIECLTAENGKYREMQLIHLLATLGIDGRLMVLEGPKSAD